MSEKTREVRIDLFCEDRAHEEFLSHLVVRLCQQEKMEFRLTVRSARGGRGKVREQLELYQTLVRRGVIHQRPDLLIVGIDTNCAGYTEAHRGIEKQIDKTLFQNYALACPDPHIERWYLADPESFHRVVGATPTLPQRKCGRDIYKNILASSVMKGGNPPTLGGIEFAFEIVQAIDLYVASKKDASFKHFLADVSGILRKLKNR